VFKLLKTKMTTWTAHDQPVCPHDTRHAARRSTVTRGEIAALFAAELASSARRA